MFSPQSKTIATILLFGVMICWGAWVPLRIKSKTEAPIFAILYISSQWVTSLILSLTFGMVTKGGSIFDGSTFIGALINSPGSYKHILYLIIAGFLNANGDFLCAAACAKLPASVANPVYGGLALVLGTLFDFFVEAFEGNVIALVGGVFSALLGIFSLTLSDHFSVEISRRLSRCSVASAVESPVALLAGPDQPPSTALLADYDINDSEGADESVKRPTSDTPIHFFRNINPWIFSCVLAGLVCGSWSPLAVLATEGHGHTDNPYVIYMLFMTGQLVAVPTLVWYYSFFDMSTLPSHKRKRSMDSVCKCLEIIVAHTTRQDCFYGCLTGAVVGTGFFFYFVAVDVIPSTIAFAVCNCAPLVTIAIDVVLVDHLKHASFAQSAFMGLAALLFSGGVALLVFANA